MRRRIENSGVYPIARRRVSSASYVHVADTVHTCVALNRHNKKRRVTHDKLGSAPVEEVQCSAEEIKAFTVANHAERKDFNKTYNIREHGFSKADTKPGRGKRAATMQPNAGPDDTEGCGVPGCKEKLAFTDVCDENGRFIPNRGYGNRDSKRRLPDTVMVFCERPGCGMATHLYHLGKTLKSDARKAAELAVRQHKAWYCSSCKDRARDEGDSSDSSDADADSDSA